ncbi:hypothetical protein DPMN_090746 [Dreissena polymorpha]|uniref:CCHC-type domain-containing protein n=1 Tax=Dreissena polymorpha TaxID=45954 RepID=A0A9D4R025_DREPO|nr:hypothetical protein DPMN_090746 [Dreissena polymorpha]
MQKLYSCTQGSDIVNKYASKLEELYAQAVEMGAITRGSDTLLKQVLYRGLTKELKHIAQYKYETIHDYDRFKIELRKFEADLKKPDTKNCHFAQMATDKDALTQLKDTVKQLQDTIERMQKEKSTGAPQQQYYYTQQGYKGGRFRGMNRGRGDYKPRRPIATNTFRGACHSCGRTGHYARDCKEERQPEGKCYQCGEEGHFARRCPLNLTNKRG